MPREDAITRGRRLVSEGRLIVSYVSGRTVTAVCRGDSGLIHRLGYDPGRGYWCACPAKTVCGHLRALMLVTIEPVIG
jgi:uncharacterized Zn finger protein